MKSNASKSNKKPALLVLASFLILLCSYLVTIAALQLTPSFFKVSIAIVVWVLSFSIGSIGLWRLASWLSKKS